MGRAPAGKGKSSKGNRAGYLATGHGLAGNLKIHKKTSASG